MSKNTTTTVYTTSICSSRTTGYEPLSALHTAAMADYRGPTHSIQQSVHTAPAWVCLQKSRPIMHQSCTYPVPAQYLSSTYPIPIQYLFIVSSTQRFIAGSIATYWHSIYCYTSIITHSIESILYWPSSLMYFLFSFLSGYKKVHSNVQNS